MPASGVDWGTAPFECAAITGLTVSDVDLNPGDSGIISLTLAGGNNDGSDVFTQQWQMPLWMNGGVVLWNATDGYHVPYTVPATFFLDNPTLSSPHPLSVEYTVTNECSGDFSDTLNIQIVADIIVNPNCFACDSENKPAVTTADYVNGMLGNGGMNDESPIIATSGAGWRVGSTAVMNGYPHYDSIPQVPWMLPQHYNYTGYWNSMLTWFVLSDMTGHGAGLNTGVGICGPFVEYKSKATGLWTLIADSGKFASPKDNFHDRAFLGTAYLGSDYGVYQAQRGDCLLMKFDPNTEIMGHGYANKIVVDGSDICGVRVCTWAKKMCIDPNLPNDTNACSLWLADRH